MTEPTLLKLGASQVACNCLRLAPEYRRVQYCQTKASKTCEGPVVSWAPDCLKAFRSQHRPCYQRCRDLGATRAGRARHESRWGRSSQSPRNIVVVN